MRRLVEQLEQLLLGERPWTPRDAARRGRRRYGFQTPPIASGLVVVALARLLERALERGPPLLRDRVGLLARDVTRLDQARDVDLAHRRLLVDERVHERLRETRLVALVVAVLAVAVHVDDDVLLEPLAELDGQARHLDDRLRVLAVHVEDRDAQHARDVGAVAGRARVLGDGGEADLVVDDQVDRCRPSSSPRAARGSASRRRRPGP